MVTTTTPVVHFYDTHERRILCGAGIEERSTKHARGITCQACVSLLATRRDASPAVEASGATA